jgi:hypothetical protein
MLPRKLEVWSSVLFCFVLYLSITMDGARKKHKQDEEAGEEAEQCVRAKK